MTQPWAYGEAELDSYIKVDRANGTVEHYHVVNGANVPITAAEYAAAQQGGK
jgi:hypothetical protein